MKPFEYYSTPQTICPNEEDCTTIYVYDKGELLFVGFSSTNTKNELMQTYPNAVIQEVLDEEKYRSQINQFYDEIHKLHREFESDLFEEFGVSDNPKRFLLLQKVKDIQCAIDVSDFDEIYDLFGNLVDLIK